MPDFHLLCLIMADLCCTCGDVELVCVAAKTFSGPLWCSGVNVCCIMISRAAWASSIFEHDTLRVLRPLQICFPGYEEPELRKVSILDAVAGVSGQC